MTSAIWLILATLLPLASFIVLVFFGKRLGNPLAGWIGTAAIAGSFVCSLFALILWIGTADASELVDKSLTNGDLVRKPVEIPIKWISMGGGLDQKHPGYLDLGVYVDSLTVTMFTMITLVSTCVFVFSLGYMAEDKRFPRFFTYLSLFCFSMLGLVIGGTLLHLFVFWELVGLCSYLLIGFWYEKKSASNAAIKAFVTNRIGDFGFLIGLGILFFHLGNVTLPQVWQYLDSSKADARGAIEHISNGVTIFKISGTLLTVAGIGLFFGAVGKSAQFPLHVWLPDAMEGPTPVSALIHAATMVAAGVYLVARIFPILSPEARLFIAIIGCITLTMAALIAIAQSDIKKVLAFSTLSQLGYMILALGIGSWVGGLFHLITHAFFKALLFLGSGSVIYAAHHEQELPQYGGLMKKIPFTAITFAIAVFAIAGTPYLSGFYSKHMILGHAGAFSILSISKGHSGWYKLLIIMPLVISYVTAFYMTRCWMLTFWGKPRNKHVYDHAHERPVMYVPLLILAVFALIAGYQGVVRDLLVNSTRESTALVQSNDRSFKGFANMWSAADHEEAKPEGGKPEEKHDEHGGMFTPVGSQNDDTGSMADKAEKQFAHAGHWVMGFGWIVGMGVGFLMYARGLNIAEALLKIPPLRWIHTWLLRRMYFDELYQLFLIGPVMLLARLGAAFDRKVVDGIVNLTAWSVRQLAVFAGLHDKYVVDGAVNGVASVTQDIGAAVRTPQSGRIRMYVTVLVVLITVGVAGAIVVALSR